MSESEGAKETVEKVVDDDWKRRAQEEKEALGRDAEAGETAPPPADLLTLVSGLAAQAFIHLGEAKSPITGEKKTDLRQARYTIDLIGMLAEKTKGNVTEEEEAFFEQVLHELRLRFVKAAG